MSLFLLVFVSSIGLALHAQAVIDVANAPFSIQILVQTSAEIVTDLQVICLFRSSPVNEPFSSPT